jgi:haloacetate dehalogenase
MEVALVRGEGTGARRGCRARLAAGVDLAAAVVRLVQAMAALDCERFAVAGHDRGRRVAYRMALDHPDTVRLLAVLDIVPTGDVYRLTGRDFGRFFWHWAFLAQAAPLPERLIGGDPDAFFDLHVRGGMGLKAATAITDMYRRALDDLSAVEGMCEDYRAGASVDRALDDADRQAGRRIACPVLALWAAHGSLPKVYADVLEVWRAWAPDLRGGVIEAGHFLAEDRPQETAAALGAFLAERGQ